MKNVFFFFLFVQWQTKQIITKPVHMNIQYAITDFGSRHDTSNLIFFHLMGTNLAQKKKKKKYDDTKENFVRLQGAESRIYLCSASFLAMYTMRSTTRVE